jgi:transposase
MILGLQDEIRRSEESRYDHRLHGVLLVAQGATCPEVSRLLGDAPRTVENWVRRFEAQGLAGLTEGPRSGRPRRLSEAQLREVDGGLRQTPRDLGLAGTLVGWEDVERLDRATLPSPLAGASMPAFVPAAGLSAA